MKFKIGDRVKVGDWVRVVNAEGKWSYADGRIYRVTRASAGGIYVEAEKPDHWVRDTHNLFLEGEFVVINGIERAIKRLRP